MALLPRTAFLSQNLQRENGGESGLLPLVQEVSAAEVFPEGLRNRLL